jgi:hypothetical protein
VATTCRPLAWGVAGKLLPALSLSRVGAQEDFELDTLPGGR